MSKLLDLAHKRLGWPTRRQIMNPDGSGPRVIAEAVKAKIGGEISRIEECKNASVGILTANPSSNSTEAPLAIVCEFPREVADSALLKAQSLAWNFSQSPQLIVVEPTLIRSFTCCKPPVVEDILHYQVGSSVAKKDLLSADDSLARQAAQSLHWVNLISGKFFRDHEEDFRRDQRADHLLLSNLRYVRKCLLEENLDEDICHDLLARVIFIQFLWDRKDTSGHAALDERQLKKLFKDRVLSQEYSSFSQILRNKIDAYKFFVFLDKRFNGDLFAGDLRKLGTHNLDEEMRKVDQDRHLNTLAKFIDGKLDMPRRQLLLWEYYSFDVIPLEFISSIYEEFLSKKAKDAGAHYTPSHIVDFLLDGVLPWNDKKWDLKILDPACGSGIFLVKAFQRLVYRWKKKYGVQKIHVDVLRDLLTNNLFGIDINPHAIRVASFSLYLAMCDEIDPIYLWQRVKFPSLREQRLVSADFFQENKLGFQTVEDAKRYDIVIGNPPWGKNQATAFAKSWASHNKEDLWPLSYNNPGPLFLPKAAALVKSDGYVSMLQPAQTLLTNRHKKALEFRKKLFSRFKVEEVVNLSRLRFGLFKDSISPACSIILRPTAPDGEPLIYICPKPAHTREDDYWIVIEPHDVNHVLPSEAANEPEVWSCLMWGGRRDLALMRTLREGRCIEKLTSKGKVEKRQGIIRGDRKEVRNAVLGKRILNSDSLPESAFLRVYAEELPKNTDVKVHSRDSTDFSAFEIPQLIIGQGWSSQGRFSSFLVVPDDSQKGILCSQSYVSVHVEKRLELELEAACLSYNSILAVYYLFATSGRCSGYRPAALVNEILSVPIPEPRKGLLEGIENLDQVDERIREAFKFDDVEWILIDDFNRYALSPHGRKRTSRKAKHHHRDRELELKAYSEYFCSALKAGFGKEKCISATVFFENDTNFLPVRLVGIHLDSPNDEYVQFEPIKSAELLSNLKSLYEKAMSRRSEKKGGVYYQRITRVYDTMNMKGRKVPTLFIIKPDEIRYWSRSMALRDADEVTADIFSWQSHLQTHHLSKE